MGKHAGTDVRKIYLKNALIVLRYILWLQEEKRLCKIGFAIDVGGTTVWKKKPPAGMESGRICPLPYLFKLNRINSVHPIYCSHPLNCIGCQMTFDFSATLCPSPEEQFELCVKDCRDDCS
ncbi:hypothetical protein CEXT_263351, partial [Caerostris extrusa]